MSKETRISLYSLNPFFYIQTRKLFLWFILIACIVVVQIIQIDWEHPLLADLQFVKR